MKRPNPKKVRTARRRVVAAAFALTLGAAGTLQAQTGSSDDAFSLPDGPGSIEGIGDDVAVNPNMGAMSYAVPIQVPEGHTGMTPDIGLSYSSAAGNGIAGMGWSIPVHSIERLTLRGVPQYDAADEFEVDQGEQLVHVATNGDGSQVYRARFEGSFVRYTWREVGDGSDGYWIAEHPDGRVSYYGADAAGSLVDDARLGPAGATFRYLLVETTDVWGHSVRYDYDAFGETRLPTRASYVFVDGTPTYEVTFAYERRDDAMSNASGGFEEIAGHRLTEIGVFSRGTAIRTYELSYESYAVSGGFSRLAGVQMFGADGSAYPVAFSFGYSLGLGEICDGARCDRPFLVDMGDTGVNLQSGNAQLLDINGDGLPDILDSTIEGEAHRIFVNRLEIDDGGAFVHYFDDAYDSAVGFQNGHDFSSEYVRVMDVDADGFVDVINAIDGTVLRNDGGGDWAEAYALGGSMAGLDGLGEAEMRAVRFLDYDADHHIDLIRSVGAGESNVTTIYANRAGGFVADVVDPIGVAFDSDAVELNDINGDGLLDLVRVGTTAVDYRLNFGWGQWSDWRTASGTFDFNASQAARAEVEDLNGDGLSDLALVEGEEVRIWINRNGTTFEALDVIDSDAVDGELPERLGTTTVLLADMNANGSSDVVWIELGGEVTYLELFPVRPNLLASIENGLGLEIEVSYGTSAEHMARDGGVDAWEHRVPFGSIVVDRLVERERLTGVERVTTYAYHDGHYDGVEKAFRGFAEVEEALAGDESQEAGHILHAYDLGFSDAGAPDPYRAGRLLAETVSSDGVVLTDSASTYGDCDVAEVPSSGLAFDVRFVCERETEVEHREGAPVGEWTVTRTTQDYDGYGNVVRSVAEGIVSVGGGACEPCDDGEGFGTPCGAECLGDEQIVERDLIEPGEDTGGRWILGVPYRERTYGIEGSDAYTETTTYYDGDFFVGLPAGRLTHGSAARVTRRVSTDGGIITESRTANDQHGNTVETIDPLGEIGGTEHRTRMTYDETGLRVLSVESLLDGDEGPYQLRQTFRYDTLWDRPTIASNWSVVQDGEVLEEGTRTLFAYDAFGRVVAIAQPGDTLEAPTWAYAYSLGEPLSRIDLHGRSVSGDAPDVHIVRCLDGRGRVVQTRTSTDAGYLVSGFTVFSTRDEEREVFMPYTDAAADCDTSTPAGVGSYRSAFDAQGRPVARHYPGDAAMEVYDYRPAAVWDFDTTDTAAGPFADTPTVRLQNGLGWATAVGRTTGSGDIEWFTITYSERGDIARVTDPLGNSRTQEHDLLGRVTVVDDPDSGTTHLTYDDNGNVVRRAQADGSTVSFAYDGMNRSLAWWTDEDEADVHTTAYDRDWTGECPAGACAYAAGAPVFETFPLAGSDVPGVEWYGYDHRSRAIGSWRDYGTGRVLVHEQRFDNLSRLVTDRYAAQDADGAVVGGAEIVVERTLDGSGRVGAIPGFADTVYYDARGDLAGFDASNGVRERYGRDAIRLVDAITVVDADATELLDLALAWNPEGWLLSVEDGAASAGLPSADATLDYDAFGRLVRAELGGGADWPEVIDYSYDAAENLVARTSDWGDASPVHDGTRTIERAHAVTQAGVVELSYDERGLVSQHGDLALTWDAAAQLRAITEHDGAVTHHDYTSANRRVRTASAQSVTYEVSPTFVVEDGVASVFVGLDGASIARFEDGTFAAAVLSDLAPARLSGDAVGSAGDGRISAADAWIAYASEQAIVTLGDEATPSTVAHLLAGAAASGLLEGGSRTTWLHRDQVDHIAAITDESGAVIERTFRYPFGAERWSSTNVGDETGFSGARTDALSGLVWTGPRAYDPHLGRWTSPDVEFAILGASDLSAPWEAMGTYVYGWNTPLTGQDNDGRAWSAYKQEQAARIVLGFQHLHAGQHNRITNDSNPFQTLGDTVSYHGQAMGMNDAGTRTAAILQMDTVLEYTDASIQFLRDNEAEFRTALAHDPEATTVIDSVLGDSGYRATMMQNAIATELVSNAWLGTSREIKAMGHRVADRHDLELGALTQRQIDRRTMGRNIRKRGTDLRNHFFRGTNSLGRDIRNGVLNVGGLRGRQSR
jgi:RHS repeat-associated protein